MNRPESSWGVVDGGKSSARIANGRTSFSNWSKVTYRPSCCNVTANSTGRVWSRFRGVACHPWWHHLKRTVNYFHFENEHLCFVSFWLKILHLLLYVVLNWDKKNKEQVSTSRGLRAAPLLNISSIRNLFGSSNGTYIPYNHNPLVRSNSSGTFREDEINHRIKMTAPFEYLHLLKDWKICRKVQRKFNGEVGFWRNWFLYRSILKHSQDYMSQVVKLLDFGYTL